MRFSLFRLLRLATARSGAPDLDDRSSAVRSGLAFMALARRSPREAARLLLGEIVRNPGTGDTRTTEPDLLAADVLRAAAALHPLRRRGLESLPVERLLRAFVSELSSWVRGNGQAETLSVALTLFGRVEAYERSHGPLAAAIRPDPDVSASWTRVERLRSEARRIVRGRCGMLVDASAANFDEQAYLDSNPDVGDSVANGIFQSGYDHFAEYGTLERRRIVDFSGP